MVYWFTQTYAETQCEDVYIFFLGDFEKFLQWVIYLQDVCCKREKYKNQSYFLFVSLIIFSI